MNQQKMLPKKTHKKKFPNIAFFDSGQGGLTIWESVVHRKPLLNTVYLGDNARCPYGTKGQDTIQRYTREAVDFLKGEQSEMVIVACGTASNIVSSLHLKTEIPVLGLVEIFCKYVADFLDDKSFPVAILGTRFTIQSQKIEKELHKKGIAKTWARACPLFVPLVEEGISQGVIADAACEMYLFDIPEDTKIVMLACTHYPRLVNAISYYLSRRFHRGVVLKTPDGNWTLSSKEFDLTDPIYLVDASLAVIEKIDDFLQCQSSENKEKLNQNYHRTYCTDSPEQFKNISGYFSKTDIGDVEKVVIGS